MHKGGEYESIAKLTLSHFEDQSDSFVFPKVVLDTKASTLTIDGTIVCDDFAQFRRNAAISREQEERKAFSAKLFDTSELEKQFGRYVETEPPLATLAVRSLHKAGADFAKGESDGDIIIQKATEEAIRGESTEEPII